MHEGVARTSRESGGSGFTETILGQNPGLRGGQIRGPLTRAGKGRRACTESNERALPPGSPKPNGSAPWTATFECKEALQCSMGHRAQKGISRHGPFCLALHGAMRPHRAITACSVTAHTQPQSSSQHASASQPTAGYSPPEESYWLPAPLWMSDKGQS